MIFDYQTAITQWSQMIWPGLRVSGLVMTMPVLGTALVPARIKVILIIALAVVCAPKIPADLSFLNFNSMYLVYIFQELLFGLLMGFILQMVFQSFVIGGQIIAMQSGLGFASMVDPSSRSSMPLVSHLYLLMISLVFLSLNGHLALLEILMGSFDVFPPGKNDAAYSHLWDVIGFSGWMLKEAVLVSLAAILAMLVVSMAFGVMAKVAPQMNIFSLGFPITLLLGMVILYLTVPNMVRHMAENLEYGLMAVRGMAH